MGDPREEPVRGEVVPQLCHTRRGRRGLGYARGVSEDRRRDEAETRDRAASRRDVDAAIRDRMADDDMPDGERQARSDAARDRMAAMRDRQASAHEREESRRERHAREQAADHAPDDDA
jgi:hypothetical protein